MAFWKSSQLRELTLLLGLLSITLVLCQACCSSDSNVSLSFWGGTDEVAGSCYLLKAGCDQVLIDCGSFMSASADDSPTERNTARLDEDAFAFSASNVDALLLTHAHLDHTGRIHYLVEEGFKGPMYMTQATADIFLARLDDDVEYSEIPEEKKKGIIRSIHEQLREVSYGERISISERIECVFVDAGHLPGSASIVVTVTKGRVEQTMTFSGDIGSGLHPFLDPPDLDALSGTDTEVLQIESTYGHASPREPGETGYNQLWNTLKRAGQHGHMVIIPAFALDRTQRVLGAIEEGIRLGHLDSNTRVLVGGKSSCYFVELYVAFAHNESRYAPYFSDGFWENDTLRQLDWTYTRPDDCKCCDPDPADAEDFYREFDIVIAPSGTGDSSLSQLLLEAFVDDPDVEIIKVGWTPPGSPMGQLAGGSQIITFSDDEQVEVEAGVRGSFLDAGKSFSGHGDIDMLLDYIGAFPHLESVIIVHGDDSLGARAGLAAAICARFPELNVLRPVYGQSIDPFSPEGYNPCEGSQLCPSEDCILAGAARDYVGMTLWVCGVVASTNRLESGRTFINLGQPYPDQEFTIMIEQAHIAEFDTTFGDRFHERLMGSEVCVYGQVVLYNGIPEIVPTRLEHVRSIALGTPLPKPCQCGRNFCLLYGLLRAQASTHSA